MKSHSISIVLVTNAYFPATEEGGPPFSNRELAEALVRVGARVTVVTTDRNGAGRLDVVKDKWTEIGGVGVFYASTKPGAWIRSRSFKKAIQFAVSSADICLMSSIFWNYTGFVTWRACSAAVVPYITYPRGLLGPWALQYKRTKKAAYWRLIARRIVNGSKAIVVLTDREARQVAALGLHPPTAIIPNGAARVSDSEDQAETDTTNCRHRGSTESDDYLLFLGRIHPTKGIDLLLPAFDVSVASGVSARLLIAGPVDKSYEAEFRRLLSQCVSADRVDVLGSVSGAKKSALLKNALAFILTSYGEGLPVAVLEAMSVGTPVIITPECSLPDVARVRAGIEVKLDVKSIANGIIAVWKDRQMREELSANAVMLVRDKYSWDSIGERTLALCRDIAYP